MHLRQGGLFADCSVELLRCFYLRGNPSAPVPKGQVKPGGGRAEDAQKFWFSMFCGEAGKSRGAPVCESPNTPPDSVCVDEEQGWAEIKAIFNKHWGPDPSLKC
ncbi:hypothetical protein KIPB_005629 [Kipferlia bialata]|uniref:Uncharacterized protein n=1 Tax=Kipferlia bialata TaxID=797122 RepID=A0A9K3CVP4_9EUKA|nr:hypothetical protein KIPB_005629 [Kipferlia bialata]|eukprot:g5629.t1